MAATLCPGRSKRGQCPKRSAGPFPGRLPLALLPLALVLAAPPAVAQEALQPAHSPDTLRIVAAEGRELVALPPFGAVASSGTARRAGEVAVQSFDTASRRVHVVSLHGETYRAAAPLRSNRTWLAFDPARRRFESLQPSIRVELTGGVQPGAVARAVGATDVTVFESLGFAIVELPDGLHPADAAARVNAMTGQPVAALRLRTPGIEWR